MSSRLSSPSAVTRSWVESRGTPAGGSFRRACVFISAFLFCASLGGNAQKVDVDSGLIAHEWGTFTSIAGETGQAVEWRGIELAARIASTWTGLSLRDAMVESIKEADQWTVQGALRNVRPLWKYSWPNGEQVYVSGISGEVVQYTTTQSRLWAYLGAIPHWLYFTPLRKNQPLWSRFVIWSSGAGTVAQVPFGGHHVTWEHGFGPDVFQLAAGAGRLATSRLG